MAVSVRALAFVESKWMYFLRVYRLSRVPRVRLNGPLGSDAWSARSIRSSGSSQG